MNINDSTCKHERHMKVERGRNLLGEWGQLITLFYAYPITSVSQWEKHEFISDDMSLWALTFLSEPFQCIP